MKSENFSSDAPYVYQDGTSVLPGVQTAVIPVKSVEGSNGRVFVMDMQASNGNALVFACGIFNSRPSGLYARGGHPSVEFSRSLMRRTIARVTSYMREKTVSGQVK